MHGAKIKIDADIIYVQPLSKTCMFTLQNSVSELNFVLYANSTLANHTIKITTDILNIFAKIN